MASQNIQIEIAPAAPLTVVDSQGNKVKVTDVVGGRGDKGWIYNYCIPVANKSKQEAQVICNLCRKTYKIKNSSLATIVSHLKTHGKLPNAESAEAFKAEQAKTTTLHSYQLQTYNKDSSKYQKRLRALTAFFYESGRPLFMADDKSFQILLNTYDPCMPRVTAKQIKLQSSNLVVAKLKKVQAIMKEQLEEKLQPSITTDIWTNKAMRDSAISFTIHYIDAEFRLKMLSLGAIPFNESHTAENIVDKLRSLATHTLQFETLDCILTTDAAASMSKAARIGGLFWMRCLLHTIHIAVQRGLDSIEDKQNVLSKCRETLSHFSYSQQRKTLFARIQQQILDNVGKEDGVEIQIQDFDVQLLGEEGDISIDVVELDDGVEVEMLSSNNIELEALQQEFIKRGKVLALVKDVETRWNSTYAMMLRMKQLRFPLEKYIKTLQETGQKKLIDAAESMRFNQNDWRAMDEMLLALEVFKEASMALETQNEPTIHLVLSILRSILLDDQRLHDDSYDTEHLAFYISNAAVNYMADLMDNDIYLTEVAVAAFLDPRQKGLAVLARFWDDEYLHFTETKRKFRTFLHFKKHIIKVVQEYAEELIVVQEPLGGQMPSDTQETAGSLVPVQSSTATVVLPQLVQTPASEVTGGEGSAEQNVEQQSRKKRRVGEIFDEDEEGNESAAAVLTNVQKEIELYQTADYKKYNAWRVVDTKTNERKWDILLWWKMAAKQYPHLAKLARWSLAVQPTSAASERAFSGSEYINDKRRINMSGTNFWQATFLKEKQQDRKATQLD